jgi:hypothetical protein
MTRAWLAIGSFSYEKNPGRTAAKKEQRGMLCGVDVKLSSILKYLMEAAYTCSLPYEIVRFFIILI